MNNPKLLIIGKVWPEPDSSAAGQRMMQLTGQFKQAGYQITFASAAAESPYTADLDQAGINRVQVQMNSGTFDRFIAGLNPDIVMFDRFMTEEQFGWRVAEQCPRAVRILDTEDLHCLRYARQQALKAGRKFTLNDLNNDIAKREIASILRSDLSLIISRREMDILTGYFSVSPEYLLHLPFMFDPVTESDIKNLPSFTQRKNFMTIGNFLHEPNRDSAAWLKQDIWPLIREKLPGAEMHLYGAYPSQKIERMHNPDEGFLVKGRTEDAPEVMSGSRVCLAPLRFGAGLKGKLAEAMICGTPSVTTPIGAESMQGDAGWPGFISESPEEIAGKAVLLYNDEEAWKSAQETGRQIINTLFSREDHGKKLLLVVNEIKDDLKAHRKANFTGAMLMHHTMASTKYMARWIEEKNSRVQGAGHKVQGSGKIPP